MDFEQAVEDWKAHDQWEFADKEAAWGFFFMAGRESKQRENEMDPHIDGVVPVQMTDAERGFLNGMLIGNLRRIYAAHDDEGNDLSALPSRAADEIERLQGHVAGEYEEAMQELDKYGIPRADGDGPTFTLRGRILRFLVRMTSNVELSGPQADLSPEVRLERRLACIAKEIDTMILNTKCDEEVNGTVVGRYQLICSLRYDGRKQGSMIYAETEEEAKRVAEDRKAEILRECGEAARDIFPLDAWELRVHAG